MPIVEIDHYPVGGGQRGPVTRQLQAAYDDLVCGRAQAPDGWRVSTYAKTTVA